MLSLQPFYQPSSNQTSLSIHRDGLYTLILYPDTRPHIYEAAPLHKGLILAKHGRLLSGEGMGFGAPVVFYGGFPYFSLSARVADLTYAKDQVILKKSFIIDGVSRKYFREFVQINDKLFTTIHRAFSKGYTSWRGFSPIFHALMALFPTLGIRTRFQQVRPRGELTATYVVNPDHIKISFDWTRLDPYGLDAVIALNEQSSSFTRYVDSDGLYLEGAAIGPWAPVSASRASLIDPVAGLSFTLHNLPPARLVRGWERVRGRFDWAGLAYILPGQLQNFTYTLQVGGCLPYG